MLFSAADATGNEWVDGLRIVEGDIFVAREPDAQGRGGAPVIQQRGLGLAKGARVWRDGLVPFHIDSALNDSMVSNINLAVDAWNRVAGITLYPVSADQLPSDYLHFQPGSGCASWVGFLGGAQEVWLSADCNAGSIMHEIGHALGLEHEHTRSDRDQFIEILWNNIHSDKRHNFAVSDRDGILLGDYDYGSIMHYGLTHFSHNGLVTIKALQDTSETIGQRHLPSQGDIESVATLYASDLSIVTQLDSSDERSEITLYLTNEHEQGAHDIVIDIQTGQAALSPSSVDGVDCQPLNVGAQCRLERLAGGATRIARLAFTGPLDDGQIKTQLRSKTPDTNLENNGGGVASEPVLAQAQQIYADAQSGKVYAGGAAYWNVLTLLLLGASRTIGGRFFRAHDARVQSS